MFYTSGSFDRLTIEGLGPLNAVPSGMNWGDTIGCFGADPANLLPCGSQHYNPLLQLKNQRITELAFVEMMPEHLRVLQSRPILVEWLWRRAHQRRPQSGRSERNPELLLLLASYNNKEKRVASKHVSNY